MKNKHKLTRLRNLKEEVDDDLHCIALSTESLRSLEAIGAGFLDLVKFKSLVHTLECRFREEDCVGLVRFD